MTHKLLEAPTEDIAHMIQAQLVVWLNHVKETRAASWFAKEWTGEHGNYTNETCKSVYYQAAEGEDQGTRGCRGGPLESEVCIFLGSAGGQCGRHGNGEERAEAHPSREAGRRGGGNAEASRSRTVV